ncbi:hypothetical protein [Methylomonas sp. AM2-LC]|uniref:hypothetical protein n=1 Tax=Methylomonas sp. AM2-LC TaxID=3153301 RepID=UPI0032644EA3
MDTIDLEIKASADWVSRALLGSGYRADFSPQSLLEIERFFKEHSQDGVGKPGGLLVKDVGKRLFGLGSYMGEVVRLNKGGLWIFYEPDTRGDVCIELCLPDGQRCWPIQYAIQRIKYGAENSVVSWAIDLGLQIRSEPEPEVEA